MNSTISSSANHLSRILVVDDSSTQRGMICDMVESMGFHILTASNGAEAISKARSSEPDLILMDVTMPEIDGYAACKEIKKGAGAHTLPIIFLTNLEDQSQRLAALEAGGDDYIIKPPHREDLLFRIKTHLNMRAMHATLRTMNESLEQMVQEKCRSLMETEQHLQQAAKLSVLGTMLSGIVHELRNPLTIISGWAQVMRQNANLSGENEKILEIIEGQAFRANNVVTSLLRMVHRKAETVAPFLINDLITNLTDTFRFIVGHKRIIICQELSSSQPLIGNSTEIEEVLINLVSNSVDAIESTGSITITSIDENEWVVLRVTDNGCGIAADIQSKIFDPFFTTKDAGKGTGLGMSIVYKIIQAHQGSIELTSEWGHGTNISIRLPVPVCQPIA